MAAHWRLVRENMQMNSLHQWLSVPWKYIPVATTDGETAVLEQPQKSWKHRVTESLASRAFWRVVMSLLLLLLLFDVLRVASDAYRKHDRVDSYHPWFESDEATSGYFPDHVDWTQFAYCQYVTDVAYLCNSLMIFEALQRLGSRAGRVMMYPEHWTLDVGTREGQLLVQARDEYHVDLQPVTIQHFNGEKTWAESFTKLLAFNQTAYTRVLSLDSDATVLQHMDELFLMPSAPVAMPRAYWLEQPFLSSQLVLVEPSKSEFNRILDAFSHRKGNDFDMEIVNQLYGNSCIVIPHRRYDLVTGEFRVKEHEKYLGSKEEVWDPDRVYEEAKFLHFSDWPLPKPWVASSQDEKEKSAPKCHRRDDGSDDCRDREKWFFVYQDFHDRRSRICH